MNPLLPSDDEIARRLADTRVAVLDATKHVRSPKRSTRYRVTRNVIIAGVAVAALTAGAIAIALQPQDILDTNMVCYEGPSLDARHIFAGGGPHDFDPIAMCETIFALDLFNDTLSEDDSHPVPELTICTMPDGLAGVFPLEGARPEDFCAALGLADWDSD